MNSTKILKLLSSFPSIVLFLYLIPFVGVCLIILRLFVYSNKKSIATPIIGIGLLLLLPKIINEAAILLSINNIPYLNNIIDSEIYPKLLDYSELLIIVGVILLILSALLKKVVEKISSMFRSYIFAQQKVQTEIDRKNDLEIKLKQERAKTTNVVYCPHCGADNILTEKVGECKFCRRQIENEER